jgi:syndecan 4
LFYIAGLNTKNKPNNIFRKEIQTITEKYVGNFTNVTGIDSKIFCQNHCSFNGYCLEGNCFCKPGYIGEDCSKRISHITCLNDCNKNGVCNENGLCICKKGFSGLDCSIKVSCEENCNEHGECLNGKCVCYKGYFGSKCEYSTKKCPNDCNNNGICYDGKCFCNENYLGKECENV